MKKDQINKQHKNLHLNLIKKWFDMIKSGEKKEEYREVTSYWCSKLLLFGGNHAKPSFWESHFDCIEKDNKYFLTEKGIELLNKLINSKLVSYKPYQTITFSNGMTPPVPRFDIDIICHRIGNGLEDWGAKPFKTYFVLGLGAITPSITECDKHNIPVPISKPFEHSIKTDAV